jgi:lipid A 3-O-deacylase
MHPLRPLFTPSPPLLAAVRGAVLALACLAAAASPPSAAAQRASAWEVGTDNDAYDFWVPLDRRPDHDYTHGMWIAAELSRAPLWGRHLGGGLAPCTGRETGAQECLSTRIEFGQKLYTPLVDGFKPVAGQRPYAGWLYLSVAGSRQGRRARTVGTVEAGLTGPESLGGAVHQEFHRIAGFWHPEGWRNQLSFEPAVSVRLAREVVAVDAERGGSRFVTLVPFASASAGNLRTDAQAGANLRLGRALPHPWMREAPGVAPRLSVYALGGVRTDWVLHDLMLDGNTFAESVRVQRRPLVAQGEVGVGVRWRRLGAEYRVTRRGRDYATQPQAHTWSTIALTVDRAR